MNIKRIVALDNFFKNLFKSVFAGAVEAGISIGTLDKYIDMVIHGENPKIQHSKIIELIKGPKIHIFEFKSHRDPYSKRDLSKLLGYGGFFAENKDMDPIELQTSLALWFIATIKNAEISTLLTSKFVSPTTYSGIYQVNWNYPYYIVIINELEIREENVLFLMNSSGQKLNEFLYAIMHQQIPFAEELHSYLIFNFK